MYLAAAGIGTLVLCDFDKLELSNLQRQIIHDTDNLGMAKVKSAAGRIKSLNPGCETIIFDKKLSEQELSHQIEMADIVVDASDNFETRFSINRQSRIHQTPLVSAAAIRYEAQISIFNQTGTSPCYHCLYKEDQADEDLSCSANGVLGPVLGIAGSMQALEVIKIQCGLGNTLDGRLVLFDALAHEWRTIKLKQDPNCPVCSSL